ncbi:MAG: formylmethanofuran dehydrogenase subunit C [Gammaproteobacteria bacterium]|nr:formylmethanofuran dehydrogenase subunit C [Gammaproteobacteria bacterium]
MSATLLHLHTQPEVPLEAETLSPASIAGLSELGIEHLQVMHGNVKAKVGDFFKVTGKGTPDIHIEGDLAKVKMIGACMSEGRVIIEGNVGMHVGIGMSGGEILVKGDATDWVGPEMSGGRITVLGDAGHMVGSAFRGQSTGITGGEIFIHGSAKNEIGNSMRRGLIAIGGDAGDFTAVSMRAGTIIVMGKMGVRTGAGMVRGTVVCFEESKILPSFEYSCRYQPLFLRLYLIRLQEHGFEEKINDKHINGKYERYSGDAVELNRGEILLFSGQ